MDPVTIRRKLVFVLLLFSVAFNAVVFGAATGTICDVTKYGAKAGGDIGPAIMSAFSSCAYKGGATLLIPAGKYTLGTRVVIAKVQDLHIQWDADITLALGLKAGDAWFQLNSVTNVVLQGKGSFDGQGAAYRKANGVTEHNPRLMRCYDCNHFEISGVTLHDAPSYHLVIRGRNGYIHDLSITGSEGPMPGTTDGIDLTCDTCLLERVNVDNGDDSIVMKAPVHNVVVRNCVFKHGNGASIGSNGNGGTWDVSNVTFDSIEMYDMMGAAYIKSYNKGQGSIRDVTWSNIKVHGAKYTVAVDQQWCGHAGCSPGNTPMAIFNLRYINWSGTSDGSKRPVVMLRCNAESPCYGMTFENFHITKPNGGPTTTAISNACGSGLSTLPRCPKDVNSKLMSLLSAAHAIGR